MTQGTLTAGLSPRLTYDMDWGFSPLYEDYRAQELLFKLNRVRLLRSARRSMADADDVRADRIEVRFTALRTGESEEINFTSWIDETTKLGAAHDFQGHFVLARHRELETIFIVSTGEDFTAP